MKTSSQLSGPGEDTADAAAPKPRRERQGSPPKYAFVDALRGLAFVGVLCHHAVGLVPGLDGRVVKFLNSGHEGVQLFFVVSAFTLFLSLSARRGREHRPVLKFYLRRFFRIAPLFYAAALFYYWYDWYTSGGVGPGSAGPGCVFSTLTFTNAWSVPWINRLVPGGWSVAVEMNFYLIVPLLYRVVPSREAAFSWALGLFFLGAAASAAAKKLLPYLLGFSPDELTQIGLFTWYWLPMQLPVFMAGVFLFHLVKPVLTGGQKGDTRGQEVKPTGPLPAAADEPHRVPGGSGSRVWLGRALLVAALYLIVSLSLSDTTAYLGHLLFGVTFVVLAWSLCLHPTVWLVNRLTRNLGVVSFSAYVVHFAVLDLTVLALERSGLQPNSPLSPLLYLLTLLVTSVVLTFLAASVTYRLIEVPGQAVGRWIIKSWSNTPKAAG